MRWAAAGLLLAGTMGSARSSSAQQKPAMLDAFESVKDWRATPSDGVSLQVSSDSGFRGRAMRLDFDFHGRGGHAVVHIAFYYTAPPYYVFVFRILDDVSLTTSAIEILDP